MNELESLFNSTAFVVNFIIQIILLIIFLRLAWNVGKIRKHLTGSSSRSLQKVAERAVFKGKPNEAIDAYFDQLFLVIGQTDETIGAMKSQALPIIKRIKELGGEFPEETVKMISKQIGTIDINSI